MPWYILWICSTLIILFTIFYFFIQNKYRHWERLGVKGPKPTFFFGNTKDIFFLKVSESDGYEQLFNQGFENEKFIGLYFFWKPVLLIKDEELLKKVTVNDFNHFMDHPDIGDLNTGDAILNSIFFMKGYIWKQRRQILSKMFTPKKIKAKLYHIKKILLNILNDIDCKNNENVDLYLNDPMGKFALYTNVLTIIGINLENEIQELNLKKCFHLFHKPPLMSVLKSLTYTLLPELHRLLRLRTIDAFIGNYFGKFTKHVVEVKEKNYTDGDDLLALLVKTKMEDDSLEMSIDEIAAHLFTFFIAGNNTILLTLCHALVHLSRYPEIQEKLRDEIDEVLQTHDELTYDHLKKMPYLNMFLTESLRYSPIIGVNKRICTKPYKIADNITIPKGMEIVISTAGFHHNEQFFPEPYEFKPERYSNDIPFVYMPFGKGPRICLGMRLAEIQLKFALVIFLSFYEILPSDKMKNIWDPKTILINYNPRHGFWIKLKKRTNAVTTRDAI